MTTMLTQSSYKNLKSLAINESEYKYDVDVLKRVILSYGFSQAAVDAISFEVSKHTLTIKNESALGGESHQFADGTPFYAVDVTQNLAGMMEMMSVDQSKKINELPDAQQAGMLAFEIGMNLFSKVEDAAAYLNKDARDARAGGVSGNATMTRFETCTGRDLGQFFGALTEMVKLRLDMLVPKAAASPAQKKNPGLNN